VSSRPPQVDSGSPGSFQGWQRGACMTLVIMLTLGILALLVIFAIGIAGIQIK
jgi:hypothetical protein